MLTNDWFSLIMSHMSIKFETKTLVNLYNIKVCMTYLLNLCIPSISSKKWVPIPSIIYVWQVPGYNIGIYVISKWNKMSKTSNTLSLTFNSFCLTWSHIIGCPNLGCACMTWGNHFWFDCEHTSIFCVLITWTANGILHSFQYIWQVSYKRHSVLSKVSFLFNLFCRNFNTNNTPSIIY